MNILILSTYSPTGTDFPEGIGGAQEVLYQLGKRWTMMGHNVKIVSAFKDNRITKTETLEGIEIERVGCFYNAVFSIKNSYYEKEKWADVVLENYTSFPLYTPVYVKKPLFVVMHNIMRADYVRSRGIISGSLGYILESTIPLFYRNAKFIAVSDHTFARLPILGIPGKNVTSIHNGIDTHYYSPYRKGKKPLIFFIGNFSDGRKRVEDLIDAFELVQKKVPDAGLIIAGTGGKRERSIKEKIRKLKNNGIKYVGAIDNRKKVALYQRSWVFLNPSIYECFTLTLMEANSCGTPGVVYQIKGLDTIRNGCNCIATDPGNVRDLADAIVKLLENEEMRNDMSVKARKFAERYDWDVAAGSYLKEFEKVI